VNAGMILAGAQYDKLRCNSPHSKNTPNETHYECWTSDKWVSFQGAERPEIL